MNSARKDKDTEDHLDSAPPPADDYIAPAPRVGVQAFCETEETAAAVRAASEDRRLGKVRLSVHMGGMAAAAKAYSTAPTSARRVHPDHWCGISSTMHGVVMRKVSKIESNASMPKS